MAFNAVILADSISPAGRRITTFELTYPRIVHAEVLTHRAFTRNAASSRAIPVKKLRKKVWDDPFIPTYWGKNQSGMQAKEELTGWRRWAAIQTWFWASRLAVFVSWLFDTLGVHKQLANRVLEPFQWYTVILTATEFDNFFALRRHPDAQPEIRVLADLMWEARKASTPRLLQPGEWHLPLVWGRDLERLVAECFSMQDIVKISTGRCARVSYETHDGKREPEADIFLCERLLASGHMSPMEHAATPDDPDVAHGNLVGWKPFRKFIPNEHNFALQQAAAAA